MRILSKDKIIAEIDIEKSYHNIKLGFALHRQGSLTLSPINALQLENGCLHMKAGVLRGDSHFYAKIITGFPGNTSQGLSPGDGAILVFDIEHGGLAGILLDQGYLTDLRTALAVRYAVECYQGPGVQRVGILGSGTQARLCAEQQSLETGCKNIILWGRSKQRAQTAAADLRSKGFTVEICALPEEALRYSDLLITTTASFEPLIRYHADMQAKLIVCVGADELGKQEVDVSLVEHAGSVVVDHLEQAFKVGELQHIKNQLSLKPITLGEKLDQPNTSYTLVDLTGVAVQDIQVAKQFFE